MYSCKYCGASFSVSKTYCTRCGSKLAAESYALLPVPTPIHKEKETASKVPAILGLSFGAYSLFSSYLYSVFSLAMLSSGDYDASVIFMFFTHLFFQLPFAIIGLVNSIKARALRGVAIAGIVTSAIGLFMFYLSFISFISIS